MPWPYGAIKKLADARTYSSITTNGIQISSRAFVTVQGACLYLSGTTEFYQGISEDALHGALCDRVRFGPLSTRQPLLCPSGTSGCRSRQFRVYRHDRWWSGPHGSCQQRFI